MRVTGLFQTNKLSKLKENDNYNHIAQYFDRDVCVRFETPGDDLRYITVVTIGSPSEAIIKLLID